MGSTSRVQRRVASAGVLSSLAVAGVVAGAGAASAGVGPLDMSMTLTTHQQALKDPLGDLTAPLPKHGPLEVSVGFSAGTPVGSGAVINSISFSCDWAHKPVASLPGITPGSRVSGSSDCSYAQPGFYEVTVTAGSSDGQTYSYTMNITVQAPVAVGVDRYYGLSRYGTAIGLTQQEFPSAPANAVVLARGDEFADALAGIPLAKAKNAALLLTPGGRGITNLDGTVQMRLGSVLSRGNTVYILGGTTAIPTAVEDQVKSMGYKVVRLAGSTRTGTALAIATDPRALNSPEHIVVARGDDFADALAAGPFAANAFTSVSSTTATPAAIVLSDGPAASASLDAATAAYVRTKLAGSEVTAIGGGAQAALNKLPDAAGKYVPIVGQDRYQTMFMVAQHGWGSVDGALHAATMGVATGNQFPDALTGGAYMALMNGPLLLSDPANPNGYGVTTVKAGLYDLSDVAVFGGTRAVSQEQVTDILTAEQTTSANYRDHNSGF